MKNLEITIGYWNDLALELTDIRTKVFIQEQAIPPELEWEQADKTCIHAIARYGGNAVAAVRLLPDGTIGRLAVLPNWRNQGVASELLKAVIAEAKRRHCKTIKLHAQSHAIGFYERFGFRPVGDIFYEAKIPHQTMLLNRE